MEEWANWLTDGWMTEFLDHLVPAKCYSSPFAHRHVKRWIPCLYFVDRYRQNKHSLCPFVIRAKKLSKAKWELRMVDCKSLVWLIRKGPYEHLSFGQKLNEMKWTIYLEEKFSRSRESKLKDPMIRTFLVWMW